jgi:hypothetical protein
MRKPKIGGTRRSETVLSLILQKLIRGVRENL